MRRGFTTVEALIAVVIAVLVGGGALYLLVRATSWSQRADNRADPRDRGARALFTIRSALMDAWVYSGTQSAPRMSFLTPDGRGLVTHDPDRKQLTYVPPGRTAPEMLIAQGVVGFDARAAGPGFVRITLTLERTEPLERFELADEVLVPFLVRDRSLPWRRDLSTPQQVEIK